MPLRSLFLVLLLLCFGPAARADILTAMSPFKVPLNSYHTLSKSYSPMQHSGGKTFLVWVDLADRAQVSQHDGKTLTTVPLDPATDFKTKQDNHNSYSLGVDKLGYIHITGNMHNYNPTGDVSDYLPPRYRNQRILYWISNKPWDVTGGFSFAGGLKAATAIPAHTITYGNFVNDRRGELYWFARVRAYSDTGLGHPKGEMALGLYRYDTASRTWTALGGLATPSIKLGTSTVFHKVLYWDDAGVDGWYQYYRPQVFFDTQNRMHFALTSNIDVQLKGSTRLMYAMSPDAGATWKRANGTSIPGLPLSGMPGSRNLADLVFDSGTSVWLPGQVAAVADAQGRPAVYADVWRRWDGSRWNADISTDRYLVGWNWGLLGADGVLSFVGNTTVLRTSDYAVPSSYYNISSFMTAPTNYGMCLPSAIGLQESGSVYCLAQPPVDPPVIEVAKLTFTRGPLPAGWFHRELGSDPKMVAGTADCTLPVWTLRGGGLGVTGGADSLHFAWTPLSGDGTLVARVATATDYTKNDSTTGLMMRESSLEGARVAAVGLNPRCAVFFTRSSPGASAVRTEAWGPVAPSWLKLVRKGNTFSAFTSKDGSSWKAAGAPATIPMASQVQVGLCAWSGSKGAVHQGTLDKVSLGAPLAPPAPGGGGLQGAYFTEPNLLGEPRLTRVDESIAFDGRSESAKGLRSIRWSGQLKARQGGSVNLGVHVTGGVRITLDGERMLEDWLPGPPRTLTAARPLDEGWHDLEVVFTALDDEGALELFWEGPDQARELIPASHLRPAP